MPRNHYLTDKWTIDDKLHFSDFRPALLSILTEAETPLTVGVFGSWGSGKTSLMRMMEKKIEEKELRSQRAVWFTAWKYDRHDALWRAFILRVLDALYPRESGDGRWEERERIPVDRLRPKQQQQVEYLNRLSRSLYRTVEWEEMGKWVMKWDETGKALAKVPAYLLMLMGGAGKAADEIGITPDMDKLLEREITPYRLEQLSSMEQFEAMFQEALKEILGPEGRLVVFVDDLDRCLPEKAIEVLEAIKLFLEVKGTVFVLGMDSTVIQRGIEARYGDCFSLGEEGKPEFPVSGASYLEKIVQVPFHLPPMAVEDVGEFIEALDKDVPTAAKLTPMTREVFAHGLLPNPRQTKRALNIFRLLKGIAKTRKMDVAWPLLAKTVLIQTQWQELYRDWRQYPMLIPMMEEAYAHLPSSVQQVIRGYVPGSVEDELADDTFATSGLLKPYLSNRREFALLERMFAFPEPGSEGEERARFEGLSYEHMEAYVRLADAVGMEEQAVVKASSDLLAGFLSGDRVLIQNAAARLQADESDPDGPHHRAFRQELSEVMSDPARSVWVRVSAGDGLGAIGDPRFRTDAWYLLDEELLGFVKIPEGPFDMGTQEDDIPGLIDQLGGNLQWYERETPRLQIQLPAYYISRYPVTVAQFRAFVKESGYEIEKSENLRGVANHPVVNVTWHDALAYARWLGEELCEWEETPEPLAVLLQEEGWQITLPSEAEWEKAARGADRRIFPWGDEIDSGRANYLDTEIGTTSAVGCFSRGKSPYGVEDLSGNVWEWCRTKWKETYENYQEDDDLRGGATRVLRGGAFKDSERSVRCACRIRHFPRYRDRFNGFRVVVSPP